MLFVAGFATPTVAEAKTVSSNDFSATPAMSQASVLTKVHSPELPSDPSGACSKCRSSTMTINGQNEAEVELYFEDDGQNINGDLQLDIRMNDGSWRYVTLSNQTFTDQTTDFYTVQGDSSLVWDDALEVHVEVVPG